MKTIHYCLAALPFFALNGAGVEQQPENKFPSELVSFVPHGAKPVFSAGGEGQWDAKIRERGWILKEDGIYKLWYTGYTGAKDGICMLGYATSPDGIAWTRHPGNPIYKEHWTEDMMVVPHEGKYYMFA